MRYAGVLFAVRDLKKAIAFYEHILGLSLVHDFGSNVTFDNGLSLQTADSWKGFLHKEITFQGNDAELYFEEDDFDAFMDRLQQIPDIEYVHDVMEHRWGQRGIRIYDPDKHIIEISETVASVCHRFMESGLTIEQTAVRMDVSIAYVKECIHDREDLR